jgi:endonuclease/exonuclease/phosphatase family metal-dependent hydrolase
VGIPKTGSFLGRLLTPRRRDVQVDNADAAEAALRNQLTMTTYNVWNGPTHAEERYGAIAELLSRRPPDVMVFQEITPAAFDLFTSQQWIRDGYSRAAVVGGEAGNYGMLMLSQVPMSHVTYTRLPTRQARGFLQAELTINGTHTVVCCVHLDSGKSSAWLRSWQLRRIFRALRTAEDAVVLGDFNMRDAENSRIARPYCDVWPALRPDDDGFTENTSINLMRYDMKDKHRHVRFDRVLLKGDRWTATDIELLGTEPIAADLPRVFPSDHFGVECVLRDRNP